MLPVPAHEFLEYTHNLTATPSTSAPGTSLASGATPHVKTSFQSIIDPTPGDAYGFWLAWAPTTQAGATHHGILFDIAVSDTGVGAGASDVILPDFVGGSSTMSFAAGAMNMIWVPLFIPEGKRVSFRWQSGTASLTLNMVCWLNHCSPGGVPYKVWSRADAYGANTANTRGTEVTAGNSGAESAWTSIGGTTSREYEALILGMSTPSSDTTLLANAYYVEVGYSDTAIMEFMAQVTTTETLIGPTPPTPMYRQIPTGTQLQIRAEASGTADPLGYALYGFY